MTSGEGFQWGESLPRVAGERVTLRPLDDGDLTALLEIFGDPDVMRFWSSPPIAGEDGARALLNDIRGHFARRTLFQWGIARLADDQIIGTTTIFQIDEEHRRGEIGFAIARSQWGHGYASEAVTLLIRFAFERLGLHRLEADPDPENLASIGVLEKLGFSYEGLLRHEWAHRTESAG